ncbi:MAG: glycosyltransferase family 2 protein [Bacteroidetes bacterium]|nr:glycosyltransferase family 2 protein [Bacteroidota bacterium]
MLSVIIITFNEEQNIRRCIHSAQGLGDEILVVDSGSTDGTVAIAKEMGAVVIHQDFLGYIEQKKFATASAKNDWILCLDADEALSPELKDSLSAIINDPKARGYTMNRLTNYCGTWVRYGGWYPDTKLRFYHRGYGTWTGVNPHDRFLLNDKLSSIHINGDILHYSYNSISDHLKQIDRFSSIGATALFQKGQRSGILKMIYKPIARFIRNYILRRGFLDGLTGFIIGVNSAHAVFLKYLRLYYLQKGKSI